jgi:diguanylate cyclase (GGDEF)-like protein
MLNPLTILVVTVLSGAIGMAVLGSLWRATIPGVGYWISANAVAIVALLLCAGHLSRGVMYGFGMLLQSSLLEVTPSNVAFLALGILAPPCLSIAEALLKASLRTRSPVAMAIIDIDSFKAVNDGYGHAAGDQVLSHFAAFITRNLRVGDVFERLGGEEFGVLCPATSTAEAVRLMDRLRARLASAASAELSRGLKYTFSVGVDQHRRDESLAHLMARADGALYAAKASGRDRVMAA